MTFHTKHDLQNSLYAAVHIHPNRPCYSRLLQGVILFLHNARPSISGLLLFHVVPSSSANRLCRFPPPHCLPDACAALLLLLLLHAVELSSSHSLCLLPPITVSRPITQSNLIKDLGN